MCDCYFLYDVANVWKKLMSYRYLITYGYRQQLYEIQLSFSEEDFAHLIGMQYLKDIVLPRYNSRKTLEKILERKISIDTIRKSRNYESKILPRLKALVKLQEVLENDFLLYAYYSDVYPFFTMIKADYLISSRIAPQKFIFIIKINQGDSDYHCCSSFLKEKRDYEINQRQHTILKKERININTLERVILFNKLKA